jgi:hypothetical protein
VVRKSYNGRLDLDPKLTFLSVYLHFIWVVYRAGGVG